MNCADVRDSMVDRLYGQLSAAARATFDEHVRGCAACSAEMASYEKTLAEARKALAGPLGQEPPPRVHAAVLAAAKQATAKMRSAVKEEPGWLARFWRTPWFLPAMGAVSVATVVFLVRVLKNPEVVPGQSKQTLDERAVPVEPRVMPAPAAAPKPEARDELTPGGLPSTGAPSLREPAKQPLAAGSSHKGHARSAAASSRLDGVGSSGKRLERKYAEPPPERPMPRRNTQADDLLGAFGKGAKSPAGGAAPATASHKKSATAAMPSFENSLGEGAAERPTEEPLSDRRDNARARPPAALAPAPTERAIPAGAPAATPPAPVRLKQAKAEEDTSALAGSADDQALSKIDRPADKAAPSLDETVRKADRLFAGQAWSAAAEAYRELLRRFPHHKDAGKWRERINQAVVAEQERRKATEAKAKAAKASPADATKATHD